MPIYEYRCEPCDQPFEALVRSSTDVPECPKCGEAERLVKLLSVPAPAQAGARASALPVCAPSGGCGAPMCGGGSCGLD